MYDYQYSWNEDGERERERGRTKVKTYQCCYNQCHQVSTTMMILSQTIAPVGNHSILCSISDSIVSLSNNSNQMYYHHNCTQIDDNVIDTYCILLIVITNYVGQ